MNIKRLPGFLLMACALLGTSQASALEDTIAVTANVPMSCTLSTRGTLSLGEFTGEQKDPPIARNFLSVNCPPGTTYRVFADGGQTGDAMDRRMAHEDETNPATLRYQLYSNSARSSQWTDTQSITNTGNGSDQRRNIFGRIFAATDPVGGNYRDTITMTLEL